MTQQKPQILNFSAPNITASSATATLLSAMTELVDGILSSVKIPLSAGIHMCKEQASLSSIKSIPKQKTQPEAYSRVWAIRLGNTSSPETL